MPRILIVAAETEKTRELHSRLARIGFTCSVLTPEKIERNVERAPDILLLEVNGHLPHELLDGLRLKTSKRPPLVALVSRAEIGRLDGAPEIDDFVTEPYNAEELALRIRRLLKQQTSGDEVIRCDHLQINTVGCEVLLAGIPVSLTFREYNLLVYLASNPGRVFSRESLLNRVWGYDYFGGDRTVDIHIRRLRSKIDDSGHSFIETVRNVGYRFNCMSLDPAVSLKK